MDEISEGPGSYSVLRDVGVQSECHCQTWWFRIIFHCLRDSLLGSIQGLGAAIRWIIVGCDVGNGKVGCRNVMPQELQSDVEVPIATSRVACDGGAAATTKSMAPESASVAGSGGGAGCVATPSAGGLATPPL